LTPRSPTEHLALISLSLRNAAPHQWDQFLKVFEAYAHDVTVAVISAPQNEVLNAQGKAVAFTHLMETFANCERIANPPKTEPPPAQ
jgi:hypothetical protein